MAKGKNKTKVLDDSLALSNAKSVTDRIIKVTALNDEQKQALKTIHENQVTFIIGTPGTGKTFVSVGYGLQELKRGRFDRIIFSRPYVEAGEKLGYLPGNFDAKTAPFMMPMYEVVREFFDDEDIKNMIENRKIVVLPFAYMRGVNFKKSYVVADEVQNATPSQVHLLLTRICEDSKIVVTGDIYQSDLKYQTNGLLDALHKLQDIKNLEFVQMTHQSCVRAKIVQDIDNRYRRDQPPQQDLINLLSKNREALINNSRPHVDDRGGTLYED